jgi:hypothetical protein
VFNELISRVRRKTLSAYVIRDIASERPVYGKEKANPIRIEFAE